MNLRCYSTNRQKICLTFLPCRYDANISWDNWHQCDDPLKIYAEDYEKLLLGYLKKVFPLGLINPMCNSKQSTFDLCSDNWISTDIWLEIIDDIKANPVSIQIEEDFYNSFIEWISEQLKNWDMIVVESNL